MSPLLEVADVRVRYRAGNRLIAALTGKPDGIEAVAGVSFVIEPGETYAIVGESGCGKTTLARSITGLVPASAGSIRFEGSEIVGRSDRALRPLRRRIAMIFQDPVGSLSPRLTVRAILAEPFRVHGAGGLDVDARIEELLGLVGLPSDFARRYPHQLSGGQARRVGVARALALDPKLVIADEPTAGLDVSVQGEILNLMNDLQERLGLAMVIITHNLNVVRHAAHRMAIMYLGRMVEEGPTSRIFDHPRHPYTLALLSANPEPDPDAVLNRLEISGEVPSLINRPPACEFHPRCPFMTEICSRDRPAFAGDGHRFACHHPR
jgi:oligopeptide/dipeptide ABC transporter ATP-binding protein